ncbi:MAG TPA: DUF4331 family protein [Ferruginibacter sp.]|nr:DUF4331 family protein [Ferruginibacter sp.]HMX80932.1 DUF4331 family protein [Ferruginibacter sp.]HNG63186.1 DUF4331 family protein [Ferruginibacter sp.]
MKTIQFLAILLGGSLLAASCKKDDDTPAPTVYYQQQDQMGRPAINTVFNVSAADKDAFNVATPASQNAAFQAKFQARLLALNPAYTTNVLGLNATVFTSVLATDILNVSTTGPTKFFTSTTDYLTGRGLSDDVIDNELTLIFGGPTATSNPALTKDNVNANDKAFSASFPYLASPW